MGVKLSVILKTFPRTLTDFGYYRELALRPIKSTFLYLALLILIPSLIVSGNYIYSSYRLMGRITEALKGNLPLLRIDDGTVIMEGRDTYRFESENEFTVGEWMRVAEILSTRRQRGTERTAAAKDEEPSASTGPDSTESSRESKEKSEAALRWIEGNFPDPNMTLTSVVIDERLKDSPPSDPEISGRISDSAHFFNFVFLVDLTSEKPQLPPGVLGIALSKNAYTISTPFIPVSQEFPEETSAVINDKMLDRWRTSILWQSVPILIALAYVMYIIIGLLAILGGCVISGLTAAFLKASLPFKMNFTISVYALTPAVLLLILIMVLGFLGIRIRRVELLLLILYAVYLIGAVRKYCSGENQINPGGE